MYPTRRTPLFWGGAAFHTPLTYDRTVTTALPLDIRRTDDAYIIQASVPGFSPDQVEVTVDKNWLVIHADRNSEQGSTEGGWVRRERRTASVYRRLALPEQTDVDAITASFVNGDLSITVPRSRAAEPRRIQVAAGTPAPAQTEAEAQAPAEASWGAAGGVPPQTGRISAQRLRS